MKNRFILGIETSCDETAAAIFDREKQQIISNQLFSQIDLHAELGGVIPETASRSHVEKIDVIVQAALDQAKLRLEQIDSVGVTNHPGLVGCLLVGVTFAKTIAWAQDKQVLGINHNHGHIASAFLNEGGKLRNDIIFPHLCISMSGGHSSIFMVKSHTEYQEIARTMDDAGGEAFDKISKLMGMGYPGGAKIEKLAKEQDFKDFFNYPRNRDKKNLNFSFSGLKTAVLYHLVKLGAYDSETKKVTEKMTLELKAQVASSFQVCIKDIILDKIKAAFKVYPEIKALSMVGGVSINRFIIKSIQGLCNKENKTLYNPPNQFCTDNAAMIALAAHFMFEKGKESNYWLDVKRP